MINGPVDFKALVQQLGMVETHTSLVLQPSLNPTVIGVAAITEAPVATVSFIESAALAHELATTQASVVILPQQPESLHQAATERGIAWIATANPRLLFAQTLALFYQPWKQDSKIHHTAVIDPRLQ